MNQLTTDQIKSIITKRFCYDYVHSFEVAEYFGFVQGIAFILQLFEYENALDSVYRDFERFANEQKFLQKDKNKFTIKDVEEYAEKFFES